MATFFEKIFQAAAEKEAYAETLPRKISGFFISLGGEVMDEHYNFLFAIPAQAVREGWSLERLTTWIEAQEIFTE